MIISFLLTAADGFFSWILGILPDSEGLPEGISDAFELIFAALNAMSFIIPVSSLFTAITIVVSYELVMWAFFAFLWVWKRIPFLGK